MAETLFDQLNRKDPGVAGAFKDAMSGKPADAKLDRGGAESIFTGAIRDKRITSGEAEALVLLIKSGVLSLEAWTFLQAQLAGKDGEDALVRGTRKRLTSATELGEFNRALDLRTVKSINFWSPGTFSHYRPIHYLAIKELVRRGEINVFELRAAGLNELARLGTGIYDEAANEFLLYQGFINTPLVVHESTHAVQDWRDFSAQDGHLEADAYIAEAVAMVDLDIESWWTPPGRVASRDGGAVDFVLAGKAVQSNRAWTDPDGPYFDVVKSTRASPAKRTMKEARGTNEKDGMHKVLEALSTKTGGAHRYEL